VCRSTPISRLPNPPFACAGRSRRPHPQDDRDEYGCHVSPPCERDKLVVEYAIAAWERPNRIPDALFARLETHFSEAQLVELTLRITLFSASAE
jgi:alkylhydroperoxidase family enzyme